MDGLETNKIYMVCNLHDRQGRQGDQSPIVKYIGNFVGDMAAVLFCIQWKLRAFSPFFLLSYKLCVHVASFIWFAIKL